MNETESPSYWLIVREERSRVEVLTIWLAGHGEALPVFSFEEEARSFCERRGLEGGWRDKKVATDELALVLIGLRADVERVALDPLPQADTETLLVLTHMGCEDFVEFLFRENMDHARTGHAQGSARTTSGCAGPAQPELDGTFSVL